MPTHDVLETLKANERYWRSVAHHADTIGMREDAIARAEKLRRQIRDLEN